MMSVYKQSVKMSLLMVVSLLLVQQQLPAANGQGERSLELARAC